ncbi:hypothetical protein BVX99_01035, partial [bacterium F16]
DFIRTTEDRHKSVVQEILQELFEKDEIYKDEYEGMYCVPCERFFTEKDLEDGHCPDCKRPVDTISETAYYFRMSNYQEWLIDYIDQNPTFIQPDFRRNETLGFLKKGPLRDLCISRPKARLAWGIELPFDPEYVCYVWFDALVNYISAIGYRRDDEMFKQWWPCSYHLIGKDILTTHTVYWPTMLKAMGVEMPRTVFAHGWWLIKSDESDEGKKMSKTDGNVVNPMDLCDEFGVDAFRYYLMAEMSLGHDHHFTRSLYIERYNQDLAGNVGNMLSRAIKMILVNFEGKMPACGELQDLDLELQKTVLETVDAMETAIHEMKISRGLEAVISAIKACNKYFEQTAPWKLAKEEGGKERLATVLYTAAESLRVLSGLLYPVIPTKMTAMRQALGIAEADLVPDVDGLRQWGLLVAGATVQDVKSLFPRIEVKKEKMPPAPSKKKQPPQSGTNVVELIDIDDFFQTKLQVATVIEAEAVEGASKLLKLHVQLREERRQIIAGIAQWYSPDDLIGKNVVIVANLKPAKIFGLESEGMLLAAKKGKKSLTILTTDDRTFPSGATVG